MSIITLTTDFGFDNWFVGTMKGVILSIAPDTGIVDLNHGINSFDIRSAVFSLGAGYRYFPEGTVHVAVIDPGVGGHRRVLVAQTQKYFFVAPDNGILPALLENEQGVKLFHARNHDYFLPHISNTFHGRDIFAPLSAYLANGVNPQQIGTEINDPVIMDSLRVKKISDSIIEGEIVFIDKFGNMITSVSRNDLDGMARIELPDIGIGPGRINRSYSDVAPGNLALLIGSTGYLELAVNQGSASVLLGLKKGDKIRIIKHS